MNGTTQSSGIALNPNQVADTAWQIQGVDTLNADTQVDLVWQHLTSNQLSVVDERGDADLWACADAVDGTSGWVIRAAST